jgi:nitrogen-specific signal transduction histidine kinase
MDAYSPPTKRANEKDLAKEIELVSKSPILDGLLHSVSGLLGVLNEDRQLVALNDSFMEMLGIHDPGEAFGLRPGEAVQCIHSHNGPDGCGTTELCSTCGAAIAIAISINDDKPNESICALRVNRGDTTADIVLLVKCRPIKIDKKRFLLLFLQDITRQHQRAALERTFFHDIRNLLTALVGASEILAIEDRQSDLVKIIRQASLRLNDEVAIQSCLLQSQSGSYQPMYCEITTGEILEELKSVFAYHPAARKKNLDISKTEATTSIKTDTSLLLRVLCNMITNALEATDEDGNVRIWLEHKESSLSFCVWNHQTIPQDIALRVFQRNYSTKEGDGRGVGTYSMKLFGETFLGGKVNFTTSEEEGTVFRFSVPL